MKRMIFAVVMVTVFLTGAVDAQTRNGWVSRYWDGCKTHCSWTGNVSNANNRSKQCNVSNVEIALNDATTRSSCDGGPAYVCWDMVPFRDPVDPNLAYAFAATPGGQDDCGKCYELTFTGDFEHGAPYATHRAIQGKKLIVLSNNIGYDVAGGQFDVMIPGGGVGQFDSFSRQLGIPVADLGERYGGFLSNCERQLNWAAGSLEQYQTCLRNSCNSVFSSPAHALLLEGCLFYANWFMAANNPKVTYVEVACPEILASRNRPGSGGSNPTPPINPGDDTYTLTINRNPVGGGTVTPASGSSHAANTPITITATPSGTSQFVNWTVAGSGATIANANSAATTVTLTANATITANFTGGGSDGTTRDTIKIEAEAFTSRNGDNIQINPIPGESSSAIGFIENGNSTTYNNVYAPRAGAYTMQLRIALGGAQPSTITINVNGSNVGTVSSTGTGGWDTYQIVALSSPVQLNAGNNTVVLNFNNAINVDFFQLIGEERSSIRHVAALSAGTRAQAAIIPASGGFTAALPSNHRFTSYRLIDLQGREVRSGQIGGGITDLRFSNIRRSVLFLQLNGNDIPPAVLRVVTY